MQRTSSRATAQKDSKINKIISNSSKNKKDLKQSSSKNLKTIKGISSKGTLNSQESKLRQNASPDATSRSKQVDSDYGVNPYYTKIKIKTSHKKQSEEPVENTDYGTFNNSRDGLNVSQFGSKNQSGAKKKSEESDYSVAAFQKIKLPPNRGLINADGKFVTGNKLKQQQNQSFNHHSTSKHSFSLNFTSRDQSKHQKKRKSKSKKKTMEEQTSREYRTKCKSDKNFSREQHHHSYYEKSRQEQKEKKVRVQKKEKKEKNIHPQEIDKVGSINSKATSIGTQTEAYSVMCLTQDNSFIEKIKDEINDEINSIPFSSIIKKAKLSQTALKERTRCITMISRICGALSMKRQSFYLTIQFLDRFINQFQYQSMKLIGLGCLTLALKMDDAEMVSKFCYHYLYNPERTVKKSGSSNHLKHKHKRQSVVAKDEVKSKIAGILAFRISEQKKPIKEDFSLEEVLDCETQIMIKFGFKLVNKTVGYWIDLLTALWDSYIGQFCPKYSDTLIFRNEKNPRNMSYVLQLVQLECLSLGVYSRSKVSIVLAAIYLIARMALQQKKQETPWQQICRFYKVSLSKTVNLIFCDGIGINVLFGDFLTLFQLSMANIIEAVQIFSKHLQPSLIRVLDFRKVDGVNREDRLATHLFCEQLYKTTSNI